MHVCVCECRRHELACNNAASRCHLWCYHTRLPYHRPHSQHHFEKSFNTPNFHYICIKFCFLFGTIMLCKPLSVQEGINRLEVDRKDHVTNRKPSFSQTQGDCYWKKVCHKWGSNPESCAKMKFAQKITFFYNKKNGQTTGSTVTLNNLKSYIISCCNIE